MIGPELNGLDGRHSGSVTNYSYSDANEFWDRVERRYFQGIQGSESKNPGTKMIFVGIKNEQQAKDLWAYLKQFDAQAILRSN